MDVKLTGMDAVMKRFNDEGKKALWSKVLYDSLYHTPEGEEGIYQSPDGKYFYAKHHGNGFTYNGGDSLVILPDEIAIAALAADYSDDPYVTGNGLDFPTWYLTLARWI